MERYLICGRLALLMFIFALHSGCSTTSNYKSIDYQYIVVPADQLSGKHKTIAVYIEGDNFEKPQHYPVSKKLKLKWVEEIETADIQIFINLGKSYVVQGSNYDKIEYEYTGEHKGTVTVENHLTGHIRTPYKIEVYDRANQSSLLKRKTAHHYPFREPVGSDYKVNEKTIMDVFELHELPARKMLLMDVWESMRRDNNSILQAVKVSYLKEHFSLLTEHSADERIALAFSHLNQVDKKSGAIKAVLIYQRILKEIKEQEGGHNPEIRRASEAGLAACQFILNSPYQQLMTIGYGTGE